MSIVSQFSTPEVEAKIKRQQRNATITSMVIAFLSVTLIALVLALILLPRLIIEPDVIVTYETSAVTEDELDQQKVKTKVQRRPAAPSSAMARVITSNTASPVSVPVPEMNTPEPSLDFGFDSDFGDSWGSSGGFGGGEASFFGQKVKAKRIAFVIDYSGSMSGAPDKLMRKELTNTLDTMASGMDFSLIFFAGPVWQAGDDVINGPKKGRHPGSFTVKAKSGGKFDWKGVRGAIFEPKSKSKVQKMEWTKASKASIVRAKREVKNTKLVYGTIWDWPLKAALELDPKPDIIYFMTDGSAGADTMDIAKDIGRKARSKNIKINCIALMQPKARQGLNELAKRTDGQFTIVHGNGKREVAR